VRSRVLAPFGYEIVEGVLDDGGAPFVSLRESLLAWRFLDLLTWKLSPVYCAVISNLLLLEYCPQGGPQ
jgi:hypothetical protein